MPDASGPVTISLARKVVPGREADYEAWIARLIELISRWPGYLGVNVLRPGAATDFAYVIICRFASWRLCHAFEKSPERAALLAELDGMVAEEEAMKRVTGLEFWFDLPEVPAQARPSPHKMALVVTLVAYGVVMTLNLALGAELAHLPLWLKALLLVTAQVTLMTYVVMPRVTRLLRGWLFGGR